MELRKVRGATEARALLVAASSSGLERASWARRQGIDPRSLNAWRVNLTRSKSKPAPRALRLVEVTPMPSARRDVTYVIVVDGVRVEVGDDFDPDTLRRLLAVVRGC